MLVGVLSDTHDRLPAIAAALEKFCALKIEEVIHCGDVVAPFAARLLAGYRGRLHVVYGNNDGERSGLRGILPQIADGPLRLEIGGRRILVHHFREWCQPADVAGADVILTGHTHEAQVNCLDGKLFVNPGECCGWVTGRCTVAVLDLSVTRAQIIEIVP
jgi:putative phosphoesterase